MSTVMSLSFQSIILTLQQFWRQQGCVLMQPLDIEVGAGTFHPATFLRAVSKEPWYAAYVQPSRRPQDGRYGDNPNRLQHYYQFQVVMKPSPPDFQALFLQSLSALGVCRQAHDIRFVEDDWESPTLGAWGLGWEVWMDGMEISQFTYFQEAGGLLVKPVMGEITYGLERLAMLLQEVDNVYQLSWDGDICYGDIYQQNEREQSTYNFEYVDAQLQTLLFDRYERECQRLLVAQLPLPAYDMTIKCSHIFNLLCSRGALSVTERANYVARVRQLAKSSASLYYATREEQGFPLLKEAK